MFFIPTCLLGSQSSPTSGIQFKSLEDVLPKILNGMQTQISPVLSKLMVWKLQSMYEKFCRKLAQTFNMSIYGDHFDWKSMCKLFWAAITILLLCKRSFWATMCFVLFIALQSLTPNRSKSLCTRQLIRVSVLVSHIVLFFVCFVLKSLLCHP